MDTVDTIGVLIVGRSELLRTGLRAGFEFEPDLDVIGDAASGREALEQAGRTLPDVVILGGPLTQSTAEVIRAIRSTHPSTRFLLLAPTSTDLVDVLEVIRAGASGHLPFESSIGEVAAAVRSIHRGECVLLPRTNAGLLDLQSILGVFSDLEQSAYFPLTRREKCINFKLKARNQKPWWSPESFEGYWRWVMLAAYSAIAAIYLLWSG